MTTPSAPQPAPASPIGERVARLRKTYLAQLPERLAQAHAWMNGLLAQPADRNAAIELHRLLHNLKGTGRSFGFAELGACATQGEALLQPWVDEPAHRLPEGWLGNLQESLQRLQAVADGLLVAQPDPLASVAPGFALAPPVLAPGPNQGGQLVYVCDDEPLVLEQLAAQLACFGYEAVCFTDPDALRSAVLARRPNAVVMDIQFPQGHSAGIDVLVALGEETGAPVPAVFLSSRSDFSARLGAVRAGGQAYFVKPVRANDLVAALDALVRPQVHEPYRVLIVDDEPEIAHYHAILLQGAGMVTSELHDPRQVLKVLDAFRPDIVLMDMYMPHGNGREVAHVIRQEPHHVGLPIVYLTSETDREKLFSAMRIGVEGFLTKPVVHNELIAAVAIRAERMRALRLLMARDSLTGLLNHTMTTQMLENALALAQRDGDSVGFAMVDIDNFKAVNDTYGHPVGDQVLLALSRLLKQRLRSTDIVGRYGGEEFAVILPKADLAQAARLIDGLREDFARVSFYCADKEFRCSFSAGVATSEHHPNYERLREAADRLLYEAKRRGRNCVVTDGQ